MNSVYQRDEASGLHVVGKVRQCWAVADERAALADHKRQVAFDHPFDGGRLFGADSWQQGIVFRAARG
ncbi:MAG: hypothetical protein DWQ37_05355 [Planctomycetota bacterium]|nr:MAG: hypothetical protein DWQ37_05355 [Planctomycetota bacterium]